MHTLSTVVAVSTLAVGLSACASPQDEVTRTVEEYSAAYRDGDAGAVCDLLDAETVRAVEEAEGTSCETGMARAMKSSADDPMNELEVRSVDVAADGRSATVTVRNGRGTKTDLRVTKVDGSWKISRGRGGSD